MYWDQVLRAATGYLRAAGANDRGQTTLADCVKMAEILREVVDGAEADQEGKVSLMQGKEWVKVAELWSKVVAKVCHLHSQAWALAWFLKGD